VPSTWSWQVILGFLSRSQRRRARRCASCGTRQQLLDRCLSPGLHRLRFASPSAVCAPRPSLSGPGPVSWPPVSYCGNSTLPWPALQGSTTPRIARPLRSCWLLIFSSTDYDDLDLPRHLCRVVHTFARTHFARGRERRDRERATRRFCAR